MKNKLSKIEIIITAILFLIACCGIGVTIHKRVDKGSGQLTMENYTDFMQVECEVGGNGIGYGNTMSFSYYVTVNAARYYKLENVTISYSLRSSSVNLPDGTLTATLKAGERYSKEYKDGFNVVIDENDPFGALRNPTIQITVNSVTGTYRYSI